MIIACPNCSTRSVLPPELAGPDGARVRCPACGHRYVVDAAGVVHVVVADSVPPAPEAGGGPELGAAIALAALRALDQPTGTLASAALRKRLFAEHGAALLDAFDAGTPGEAPAAAEFRAALHRLTGVDLGAAVPAAKTAPGDPPA